MFLIHSILLTDAPIHIIAAISRDHMEKQYKAPYKGYDPFLRVTAQETSKNYNVNEESATMRIPLGLVCSFNRIQTAHAEQN